MPHTPLLIRAAAVRDAQNVNARPGAVLIQDGQIVSAGHTESVERHCDRNTTTLDLPDRFLLPTMVNAHAHLELSNLDPAPYPGTFVGWLREVIGEAPTSNTDTERALIRGVGMSLSAGVGYVGDITRSPTTRSARHSTETAPLPGVAYLECFGIGAAQTAAIEQLQTTIKSAVAATGEASLGIQPHAPYSAGQDLYNAASQLARTYNLPLTTHLAETLEEIQFVQDVSGPFADLLRAMGKWDDSIKPTGQHPIDWLYPRLAEDHWLLAHCNYIDNHHIGLLAETQTSVAYCPVASDYFGHRHHRYRDLLDAGVNVALGTDSLMCQPPACNQPLSILAQMRHLYRRDRTDPCLLLCMATTHGARALELPESVATLQPGSPATLTAVKIDSDDPADPLIQALQSDLPLKPLTLPNP